MIRGGKAAGHLNKRPVKKGDVVRRNHHSQSSNSFAKFRSGDQSSRKYDSINANTKAKCANLGKKNEHTVQKVAIAIGRNAKKPAKSFNEFDFSSNAFESVGNNGDAIN